MATKTQLIISDWGRIKKVIWHVREIKTGQVGGVVSRKALRDFAEDFHDLEYPLFYDLCQIKAGVHKISWAVAGAIFTKYPQFNLHWLMGLSPSEQPEPLTAPVVGTWNLTEIYEYVDDCWKHYRLNIWGPIDIVFDENNLIEIYTPGQSEVTHYCCIPQKRLITYADNSCYIFSLASDYFDIISPENHGNRIIRYIFNRIPDEQLHNGPEPITQSIDINGEWLIDYGQEYSYKKWKPQNKDIPSVGPWIWKFDEHWDTFSEYKFGCRAYRVTWAKDYDKKAGIIRIYLSKTRTVIAQLKPDDDNTGIWAYILEHLNGDYRESKQRLHLTKWDRGCKSQLSQSLYWAEKATRCCTPADRIPIALLRLWHQPNPANNSRLIASGELLSYPRKYRSSEYTGAYVFLHYYTMFRRSSGKTYRTAPEILYQHFNEIIGLWLDLYQQGENIENIHLFYIKRYSIFLKTLHQAATPPADEPEKQTEDIAEKVEPEFEKAGSWFMRILHGRFR